MRQRNRSGSIGFDARIKTWHFVYWENGKRRSKKIGHVSQYPTKASAWRAAKPMRDAVENQTPIAAPTPAAAPAPTSAPVAPVPTALTVSTLVEQYRVERMPKRYSTRRSYESRLKNHILPKWGACEITAVEAMPVEMRLESLDLTPRTRAEVRGLLRIIWNFAMWRKTIPAQSNPMELVSIKGSSKRNSKPRSLPVGEYQQLITHLREPFRTISLVCVCFGLRISEALALKWSDVDWLNGKLSVERGIVRQHVDDTKTENSRKQITVSPAMLEAFKTWKQTTQFSAQEDWIFASPTLLGRLPWSADSVNDSYQKAASEAGIAPVSTHSMRHTYRSWLDAVGTPIAVQQKLMRHADIRTTMNTYGDVVTDEMAVASTKVSGLALNGM